MGIADRDYYRDRGRRSGGMGRAGRGGGGGVGRLSGWSVNTWLIAVNVAIYLVQGALQSNVVNYDRVQFAYRMDPLQAYGHFSTVLGFFDPKSQMGYFEVWRLITFQFLHANFVHLFFNMFGLYIFGSIVEQFLGRRRYLAFYLVCGIFGGLTYLLLNFISLAGLNLPGALNTPSTKPLIGASAGVFGVIMACAYIAPNAIVQLILPPVPLRLKWFAYGYVGIAAANLFFFQGANQGGDAAHLGGAIAGFFFIRNAHLLGDFFDVFKDSRNARAGRPPGAGRPGRRNRPGRGGPNDAEVDRILAKVATHGVASLTESERGVLAARTDAERRRRA
jgi:membrane associated rhomboid family serine protease